VPKISLATNKHSSLNSYIKKSNKLLVHRTISLRILNSPES